MVRMVVPLALALLPTVRAAADDPPAAPTRAERLAAVGRLWGEVKFRHPAVWTTDLDWDAALVSALPAVAAAETAEQYADAVGAMLARLGDPATRVVRPVKVFGGPGERVVPQPGGGFAVRAGVVTDRLGDGLVAVRVPGEGAVRQWLADPKARAGVRAAVAEATGVVFDLRTPVAADFDPLFDALADLLVHRPVDGPPVRAVVHSGYRPQSGTTSGGYYSAFETRPGTAFRPAKGAKVRHVAFQVNG
ncbi:MAG TPA: hypothetical protein VM597_36965, partial [Gemmataceae bacterium]|nr:hypothetical protein [Gemmataceae bacterium]